jgi:hypothetical protein
MIPENQEFCFATLALGKNYRHLALTLASDIETYCPNTTLIVLTDNPQEFCDRKHILAVKHRQNFFCDNDKCFLIEKALSLFDCCICIDADMRLLAPFPQDLQWLPGITARSLSGIIKHHQNGGGSRGKALTPLQQVASKLNIDLNDDKVKWIHEFMFVVKKDGGKEREFARLAEMISRYLELNDIKIGSGSAMGLAAAKVGFPVRHDPIDRFAYFKDRIEKIRIEKGQVDPNEKLAYFQTQQQLEFPKYSGIRKVFVKVNKLIKNFIRSIQLKFDTLSNVNFYYR